MRGLLIWEHVEWEKRKRLNIVNNVKDSKEVRSKFRTGVIGDNSGVQNLSTWIVAEHHMNVWCDNDLKCDNKILSFCFISNNGNFLGLNFVLH